MIGEPTGPELISGKAKRQRSSHAFQCMNQSTAEGFQHLQKSPSYEGLLVERYRIRSSE
jgi:hypothetical protein